FSFSWSFSNPTLYVSSSYPISWYVNVSHLLNEYPSYASNTINFGVSPATYSRVTYGSDSTQYFDFIYYYNSTSSSADSVTFTVTTSELVNNYPTITYASLKYSGHGSTEVLTVNASNPFKNETLQLTNVNWGDGSPTQNSPIETPIDKNYYNFTLTHQYNTTGTFTVTLLVVNAVGNSVSLSSSAHGSISLSISINYTSNALPVKTNTRIFFNYTQVNVNVQNVYLFINNILVQANNTTSNTNYNGAVSYVIPYYLTQTAEFYAKWIWTAGGISGSQVIQYSVANSVPTVGTWLIVNYTIGTGSTATKESIPYFYTQRISFNFTWSYYVWQILLPPNSLNITVKGNPQWKDPIISVPANYYANISTFALLISTSEFQVTWLAPNNVQTSLIVIEYYPETSLWGLFGVTIPFSDFHTYLNGQMIYSPTQTVSLGSTVIINTTSIYGTLISSYSFTATQSTEFVEIPLDIVPFTVYNMNSSYVIEMTVSQGSITQTSQVIMPLSQDTFYAPAGTYNFSFTYLPFSGGGPVKYYNITRTLSGVSYVVINGVTLTQLGLAIHQTQQNITSLVENVNISLANSNDYIKNQIIHLSLNLTNVNSTIINQINTVETQIKNTNTTLYNQLLNVITDVKNTNTTVVNQANTILLKLKNYNSTLYNQTLSILANIKDINTSIINEIITTQTDIKNTNTTLYNQIATAIIDVVNTNSTIHTQLNSLLLNLKNDNSTLYNQTLKMINDILNANSTVKSEALSILTNLKNDNSTIYNETVGILTQIKNTNTTLYNQIANVLLSVQNANTTIHNQISRLILNLTNTNSTIYRQLLVENTSLQNILSKVETVESNINIIQNNILSQINSTALNITTKETTIKDLVSLSLQEENATFSYQLRFGTPSVSGTTYQFPVFVSLFNGQMANLSVTQQAWQNMRLYYISDNRSVPLNFSVTNVRPGSFIVEIYNITPAMASSISSNDAVIAAQGEVKEGVLTNLAAGIIGSQQVRYSSNDLWTEIFGLSPPRGNASINGMFEYLSWLGESYAGRAIYLIVILAALAYYTIMINSKLNERRKKK
ncbi:MAG: hypothetical protein QXO75_07605, partial [Nitrososphaerota archaeon]